jgi:uncharacterized protein YqjF (DUF2071 family)
MTPIAAWSLHRRLSAGAAVRVFQNDFDYSVMDQVAHRPYPMPRSPWVMTQTWHDLLFLHWPVDGRMLRERIPGGLELDLFDGQAYVAITPFHMTNLAPRGVPALPKLSSMPEVNVRTYVTAKGVPGVYFFSLDAGTALAVGAARAMYFLPYFTAKMDVEWRGGWLHYHSRRSRHRGAAAELRGRYRSVGAARESAPGSLEYFLTERYCLYTVDDAFHLHRAEIHHGPWLLSLAEAEFEVNTMAEANRLRLPSVSPLAHFAKRQDTVVWSLHRV